MKTLKMGSRGDAVVWLQELIGVDPAMAGDEFGTETEGLLADWQHDHGLFSDGVAGPMTWMKLHDVNAPQRTESFTKVSMDKYQQGYGHASVRTDMAPALCAVRDEVRSLGGIFTSIGGTRALHASVGSGRSRTSRHYCGLAIDNYTDGAMVNPHTDPCVAVRNIVDGRWRWQVWVRVTDPSVPEVQLDGFTYSHDIIPTEGRFVNLTEIYERNGFVGIPARSGFVRKKQRLSAEHWHYSYVAGMTRTFFGWELMKVYTEKTLQKYPRIWNMRACAHGYDWGT